jgi:hypothetical protein
MSNSTRSHAYLDEAKGKAKRRKRRKRRDRRKVG